MSLCYNFITKTLLEGVRYSEPSFYVDSRGSVNNASRSETHSRNLCIGVNREFLLRF